MNQRWKIDEQSDQFFCSECWMSIANNRRWKNNFFDLLVHNYSYSGLYWYEGNMKIIQNMKMKVFLSLRYDF